MHKIADYYGPIVYTKFGTPEKTIPYDSQEKHTINFH